MVGKWIFGVGVVQQGRRETGGNRDYSVLLMSTGCLLVCISPRRVGVKGFQAVEHTSGTKKRTQPVIMAVVWHFSLSASDRGCAMVHPLASIYCISLTFAACRVSLIQERWDSSLPIGPQASGIKSGMVYRCARVLDDLVREYGRGSGAIDATVGVAGSTILRPVPRQS